MELVVLIGLPGAGKSTFFQQRFAATHQLVSKDLLRPGGHLAERQAALIEAALARGQSVVLDNTNPARVDRAAPLAQARRFGARVVGYFFVPDLAGCRRRNAGRTGRARVPDVALRVAARRLELPEHAEGFDEIYDVRLDEDDGGGGGFAASLRARASL
jgi:predicted kinase